MMNMNKMMSELPEKPLSRERENELARLRTEDARNELVMHAMREALAYSYRVSRGQLDESDLYSLCYLSLHKAARNFKENIIRFFSYAKIEVRRGVINAWKEKDVVRNSSIHETDVDYSYTPKFTDDGLLGGETGNNEDWQNVSIHEQTGGRSIYVHQETVDPEIEQINIRSRWELVKPIIDEKLDAQQKMVLDLYYNGDLTFEEIGKLLGVCRARTQMIKVQALKKIRCELMRRKALFSEA